MAMLLCDMVITDPDTGKKTLVGIFDRLNALQFPTKRTMTVYAKLTDVQGKYNFRLQFIGIDRDQVLGEVQSEPIEISSRLEPFQFHLPITVGVEHPGPFFLPKTRPSKQKLVELLGKWGGLPSFVLRDLRIRVLEKPLLYTLSAGL